MNITQFNLASFKNTVIGRIPKEWEVVRLGRILSLRNGERPSASKNGIFPIYGANGIMGYASNFLVDNNFTIVIGRVGASGEVHLGTGKIWISDNAIYSENYNKNKVYMTFLYHLLKFKKISQFASKSTHPIITQSFLNSFLIPLPPLPEQQKIAEILSTVDSAIEKVNQAIEKTQRLKKGLMQELLTKGIGHNEFKDTEIGRIPKEWEVVRLGEVIKLCQYGLSVKISDQGKYPIIKMDDIVNGYIVNDNVKYVDIDEETYKKFKLEKGDVLFNRTNSYELVGRTGIFLLNGGYVFASYLIRLKPNRKIVNPHFLTFYLIFSNEKIRQLATRAVHQANINATNLQNLKLPLPPLPEQQKIAEILSTVDKRLELLRAKKEKLERIKKGLMNDLLTGKRRIRIC